MSICLRLGLPKGLFPVGWPVKILTLQYSSILATWSAHLNLLDLFTLAMLGKRYKLRSSPLWSLLRSPFSSSVYCFQIPINEITATNQYLPTFFMWVDASQKILSTLEIEPTQQKYPKISHQHPLNVKVMHSWPCQRTICSRDSKVLDLIKISRELVG